jgi:tetratricopeptide (TPR) repeat protein
MDDRVSLDRRVLMGVVVAAIVPAFGLTRLVVNRYRAERRSLALEWSLRGRQELRDRPESAVTDFETALSYDADAAGSSDRFFLAKALVAAGRPAEATAQLETLAAADAGNADVHLELARIAAARGEIDAAVRSYHLAIDGVWSAAPLLSRRAARVELARVLLHAQRQEQAQAELIALVADLPPEPAQLIEAGRLLGDAGATARALALYRRALSIDPANGNAAALAGGLEFRGGDMRAARVDLRRAMTLGALDAAGRDLLDVSDRVLALDPFADRLTVGVRAQRAIRALDIARGRLDRCRSIWEADAHTAAAVAELDTRLPRSVSVSAFQRNPDSIDEAVAVAVDIEKLPSGACGAGTADDRALAVIGTQHPGTPQ